MGQARALLLNLREPRLAWSVCTILHHLAVLMRDSRLERQDDIFKVVVEKLIGRNGGVVAGFGCEGKRRFTGHFTGPRKSGSVQQCKKNQEIQNAHRKNKSVDIHSIACIRVTDSRRCKILCKVL
jgi:hypothetical protein